MVVVLLNLDEHSVLTRKDLMSLMDDLELHNLLVHHSKFLTTLVAMSLSFMFKINTFGYATYPVFVLKHYFHRDVMGFKHVGVISNGISNGRDYVVYCFILVLNQELVICIWRVTI